MSTREQRQGTGVADVCSVPAGQAATGDARAIQWVLRLSLMSLVWMTAEGVLGLWAGLSANSISLIGWALGSVIEGLASVIVIWRFTGDRALSDNAERRAQQIVAVSFWLLAPYITVQAVRDLLFSHSEGTTVLGVAVTASSLLVMPSLGLMKRRLARTVGSRATAGEGTQNLLCAAQALAVLVGLGVRAATGVTWVDPVIALVLAAWAVKEGRTAWQGEDCC